MEERALALINDHTFTLDGLTVTLFSKKVIPRDKYVPRFSHPFFVFIVALDGEMLLSTADNSVTLSKGDYILIRPGCDHIPEFLCENTSVFCLSVSLSGSEDPSCGSLYDSLTKRLYALSGKVFSDPEIFASVSAVINALNGSRFLVISEFARLLDLIIPLNKDDKISSVHDTDLERLHRINTVANVYYDRNISVEDLGRMLYLSPRQVSRIIENNYGMSWSQLIGERRMKVARDLLESSDMSVEQISEYVGFSSPRGFYSAYKRYYGTTPRRSSGVEHTLDE